MFARVVGVLTLTAVAFNARAALAEAVVNHPVRDPETGAWYELVRPDLCPEAAGYCISWDRARQLALSLIHI